LCRRCLEPRAEHQPGVTPGDNGVSFTSCSSGWRVTTGSPSSPIALVEAARIELGPLSDPATNVRLRRSRDPARALSRPARGASCGRGIACV